METLIHGLSTSSTSIERFASPLNFNPRHPTYFSMYKEDQVFGATENAYSQKWHGSSQANPEYEAADMEKAVRWALVSAQDPAQPSLTAFILPDWGSTGNALHITNGLRTPMFTYSPRSRRQNFGSKHLTTGKLVDFMLATPNGMS